MSFVFTSWYFVIIALVACIVACLLVFFRMDKTDRVLIKEFVEQSQTLQENQESNEANEEKTE